MSVLNWDRTVHKNARTEYNQAAGNMVVVDKDYIIIIAQGASICQNQRHDRAEVFVKLPLITLDVFCNFLSQTSTIKFPISISLKAISTPVVRIFQDFGLN